LRCPLLPRFPESAKPLVPTDALSVIRIFAMTWSMVRTSRLGLTWADGVWLEGCPQVKRAQPTFSGVRGSGSAGLWLLGDICLDDLHGEVLQFAEQGAEFLRVVE
jgi:hypothetical protein